MWIKLQKLLYSETNKLKSFNLREMQHKEPELEDMINMCGDGYEWMVNYLQIVTKFSSTFEWDPAGFNPKKQY